ncbi:MAG: S49 family peptidase [bacterium]|nr:S49 family peptidase [bacterium]
MSFLTILFFACIVFFICFKIRAKRKAKQEQSKNKTYSFDEIHKIRAPNTIAILHVTGPILTEPSSVPAFLRQSVSFGDEIHDALLDLAANSCVQAVILRFNTPGGTISGSQAIADGISLCGQKKATWAHVIDLSASGGVLAMVTAHNISAEENALIGSIGVIGPTVFKYDDVTSLGGGFLGTHVVAQKITSRVFSSGKGKAFGNPHAPRDTEAEDKLQEVLDKACEQFRRHVEQNREEINPATLREIGAHIFNARTAKELGLIDFIFKLQAVKQLIAENITKADPEKRPCHFVEIKRKPRDNFSLLFSELFSGMIYAFGGNPLRGLRVVFEREPVHMLGDERILR